MKARYGKLTRWGIPIMAAVLILVVALAQVAANDNNEDNQGTDPGPARQVEPVTIEQVDVRIAESFPVQVFVEVRGYVPDPCWEPQTPTIDRQGPRFEIEIVAERPEDAVCAQVIEPYEENIALGQMEPGIYVVNVNGVEESFEVQ